MAEVVITEPMDDVAVAGLAEDYDLLYDPALADRRPDLLACVRSAHALVVRNRTQVDGDLLDAAPGLRLVGRLGVGLDNIDVAACRTRGVEVRTASGANARAVAEYVIGALLLLMRPSFGTTDAMLRGTWPRWEHTGRELGGRCLGLVGLGVIAQEVAARAGCFGMDVIANDPYLAEDDPAWDLAEPSSLDEVLRHSDVVSVHVPLVDATRRLIDAGALRKMRSCAVLVNTSRGGIVDEAAVADALRAGRLGGAALDVFEAEPLTPAAAAKFFGAPNLLLTPHIAGITEESNAAVSSMIAEHVRTELSR